jgi:hypothetical protein
VILVFPLLRASLKNAILKIVSDMAVSEASSSRPFSVKKGIQLGPGKDP